MTETPIDPTKLTTQQLWREIAALKELVFTRMDAMDKAVATAHDDLVRVPTEVQKTVGNLKELHEDKFKCMTDWVNEKFAAVSQRFDERDVRVQQTATHSKMAIDAALAAAKEAAFEQNKTSALAISKSEAITFKQIDQQGLLLQTATKGLEDKINDVKDRMTKIEGMDTGTDKAQTARNVSNSLTFVIIGLAIMLLLGIAGIAIDLSRP